MKKSVIEELTTEINTVTGYTVEALVSGHPRDAIKMSVTGAGTRMVLGSGH